MRVGNAPCLPGEGVDINHASLFELECVFHDRERAQQVLNKRELLGDFTSWDDVRERMTGMSDELIRQLSAEGLTIGEERAAATPAAREGARRRPSRRHGLRRQHEAR